VLPSLMSLCPSKILLREEKILYRVAAIFPDNFQSFTVASEKTTCFRIILRKTVSALCRSRNKNKQAHSGKDKSTESYENCHSLQASRRGRTMRKILSWNLKKSMGARNRGGIGLSYRPARLHRLAEFIPWNRFLGSINV
jgi:hypothetical protein